VTADFDLNFLSLYRSQGQEMSQYPGLLAGSPPRRPARGRENDALMVYLTISGNSRFPPAELDQLTTRMAGRFYQTTGSLTSAIRAAVAELNQSLLNRNLKTTGNGEYAVGQLITGVLRGTQFVFAQSGPTHIFHLTGSEARQIHDEQIAGRGLGIGQNVQLYFTQADLHPGDTLVLCPSLPIGWDVILLSEKNASIETLRRRLLSISSGDLNTVLIQAQAGKGNFINLKGMQPAAPAPTGSPESPTSSPRAIPVRVPEVAGQAAGVAPTTQAVTPAPGVSHPSAIPSSQVESGRPASRFSQLLSGTEQPVPSDSLSNPEVPLQDAGVSAEPGMPPAQTAAAQPFHRPVNIPPESSSPPLKRPGRFVAPRTTSDIPEIKRPISRRRQALFGGLGRFIRGVRGGTERVSRGTKKVLPTLLPGSREETEVSSPSMALFAIVVPVIIVALAVTVYFHYGRTQKYQQNYEMALAQASQARDQTNPTEVRHAWDSTIYYLDLAEKSLKTQESTALRQQAQTALDNLDGILRLDFRPAISGGLSSSVQISHMAATDTDLYLLDAMRGNVIRAFLTDQGYEVDPSFQCEPGVYGSIAMGALVDLKALPMSNIYNARVMAIDGRGNLLYCGLAGSKAVALVAPQLGWRGVAAFSLDSDGKNIYVLDPVGNAVWQYSGNLGEFTDPPTMFFGEQVPQNMKTAIDLATNGADLYMLFQDGHVTACPVTRYVVAPMRCADPATFVDTRPERQPGSKINDAIFSQMTFASAPDPSLYLLEPLTRAVYRFSPRSDSLELRGQFRATLEQTNTLFNGPATAMTIGPNRYFFFSVGNQIFYATDVP
jgi:hypothetical protein